MEHLSITKNARASSSSPARMAGNAILQRLSPIDIALATVNSYKYPLGF